MNTGQQSVMLKKCGASIFKVYGQKKIFLSLTKQHANE